MTIEIRLASGATEADIVKALAGLPSGGTLVLPPGETIAIRNGLIVDVAQRDITIDLNGSTLQQAGNVPVISGRGQHSPLTGVTLGTDALGQTTITYGPLPYGLAVGDWIKVVADDVLPGDHLDGSLPTRMGQALQITAIDGNTVTLSGVLADHALYQTNVRATAYRSGELTIKNGQVVGDQSQSWSMPLIETRMAVSPLIEDVRLGDGRGYAISIVDSVNAEVKDVVVQNMLDGATVGIGVHSMSSTGTSVNGLYAENVTHAADNNSIGNAANAARAEYYGADIGMYVSNSAAYATRNFAWSWHSEANDSVFDSVMAFDSYGFLMARGIGNVMLDSGGANNQRGIVLYEWGDGDARDITVQNVVLKETLHYASITINDPRENRIVDSWFESYGAANPVGAQYAVTEGTIYVRADGDENDLILGAAADSLLLGGKGDDTILGGTGADYVWGGAGADFLSGGGGRDRYAYHALSEAGDVIHGFEAGAFGDVIDLSVLAARLGWSDAEPIASGRVRFLQSGADTQLQVDGGGDGFVTLATLTNTVAARFTSSNLMLRLSDADKLSVVATAIPGVPAVNGDDGADLLQSAAGNRELFGLGGDDRLLGGDASDILDGGAGDDVLAGDGGSDNLYGGAGADALTGGEGADRLLGGDGDDLLDGGVGADTLSGGLGSDTVTYAAAGIGTTADLADATANAGAAAGDYFSSVENLVGTDFADVLRGNQVGNMLAGGAGDDRLEGRAGSDTLFGGAGDDWMDGGAGKDLLTGGAGGDSFYFAAPGEGGDTVTDFTRGEDMFVLSAAGFGLDPENPSFVFVSGSGLWPTTTDAALLYYEDLARLVWDADGSGAGKGVLIAILEGQPQLTLDDFLIV